MKSESGFSLAIASQPLGQLVQLFSYVKIQDLKVSLGLEILIMHCDILYILE